MFNPKLNQRISSKSVQSRPARDLKRRQRKGAFSSLRKFFKHQGARLALSLALIMSLISSACFQSEPLDAHYGRVIVPRAQEFRWSDGGLPQVFDPALAAAPPDTDAVRAMFEGLTDFQEILSFNFGLNISL